MSHSPEFNQQSVLDPSEELLELEGIQLAEQQAHAYEVTLRDAEMNAMHTAGQAAEVHNPYEAALKVQQDERVQSARKSIDELFTAEKGQEIKERAAHDVMAYSPYQTGNTAEIAHSMATEQITGDNKFGEVSGVVEKQSRKVRASLQEVGISERVIDLDDRIATAGDGEITEKAETLHARQQVEGNDIIDALLPSNRPKTSKVAREKIIETFTKAGRLKELKQAVANRRRGGKVSQLTARHIGRDFESQKKVA